MEGPTHHRVPEPLISLPAAEGIKERGRDQSSEGTGVRISQKKMEKRPCAAYARTRHNSSASS